MNDIDISMAAMVAVGVILLLWKSKRRFGRLNQYGIEKFSTFRQKIGAHIFDGALRLSGFVLLGTAAMMFFVEHGQSFPTLSVLVGAFFVFLIVGSRGGTQK